MQATVAVAAAAQIGLKEDKKKTITIPGNQEEGGEEGESYMREKDGL